MNRPYLGFAPVVVLVALIAALGVSIDSSAFEDPDWLIWVSDALFVIAIGLTVAVAFVGLRTFAATGQVQVLLLGCGTLIFGDAVVAAAIVKDLPGGANLNLTIYDTGALMAAIVFLAAAMALLAGRSATVVRAGRRAWVAIVCAVPMTMTVLLTATALVGATPPFSIPATGPTPLGQGVLAAADALFAFAALTFVGTSFRTRDSFLRWYGLALALTCVSLTAFFVQSSVGSPVGWAGRIAQYLGAAYLLVALFAARTTARERKASLGSVLAFSLGPAAGRALTAGEASASAAGRMGGDLQHIYLEQSADAFYVKDAQGRYLLFNGEAARTTGKRPDEVIGKDDTFLFPAAEAATVMAGDRAVMEGRRVVTYEEVLQTVNGTATYLSTKGPLFDDDGKVVGLFGFARDVTEHKRAEAALHESEERYRALFDSASDPVFVVDMATTRILDANSAASSVYGFDHAELLTLHATDVSAEPDETSRSAHDAQDAPDQILTIPVRMHRRKDGTVFPVEIRARNIPWHGERALRVACRDITERRTADEALRESEERYRRLAQNAPDLIYRYELAPRRGFSYVSPAATAMTGFTPEDHYADPDLGFKLVHPDDRHLLDGAARGETTPGQAVTLRWLRKDGATIWTEQRNVPILDAAGNLVAIEGIARDITERVSAAEALSLSREQLKLLRDSSADSVYAFDLDGRFTSANRQFCLALGLSEEQVVGRTPPEVGLPEDGFRELAAVHVEAIASDRSVVREVSMPMPDGQVRFAEITLNPVHDRVGRVIGIAETSRDITARKVAEETLRQTQKVLLRSQHVARLGSWVFDPVSLHIEWSDEMYAMYGIDRATRPITIDDSAELIHPDDRGRYDDLVHLALSADRPFQVDLRGVRLDGTIFHQTTWGEVEVGEDGARTLVGTTQDITDRKRAEAEKASLQAQLEQAQKMESVGRLAGGVAHDFNNMLGVILGNTELALEALEPSHPVRADLLEVQDAARRSADLTRQLLAFARRQTVTPKVLDLNETVHGMLEILRRLVLAGVELSWRPGADAWPVLVDPSQLDQVLTNLVVNAGDAIGAVGRITIETGNATLDADDCAARPGAVPGEYVVLSVTDNGRGMDAETMSHLFEPFFTTKEVGKGTGLGLATVYGIVKQNEGFTDAESELGTGTTFRVYLPRHRSRTTAPEAPPQGAAAGGGETVLVVEDEPAILRLGTAMLERLGYDVISAATPSEAIRLAREHAGEIHLLITDVVMPETNGRDLARSLLSLHPRLRRLFMSGYTADVIADHGVLDKGVHFLLKPFSARDLAAKVREALDQAPVSANESAG